MGGVGSNQYQSKPGGKGPRENKGRSGGMKLHAIKLDYPRASYARNDIAFLKRRGIPAKAVRSGPRGNSSYTLHTTKKGISKLGLSHIRDFI